jgi:hypothetical protein
MMRQEGYVAIQQFVAATLVAIVANYLLSFVSRHSRLDSNVRESQCQSRPYPIPKDPVCVKKSVMMKLVMMLLCALMARPLEVAWLPLVLAIMVVCSHSPFLSHLFLDLPPPCACAYPLLVLELEE